MDTAKLHTEFAPAERASTEEIIAQSKYFQNTSLLKTLLAAIPNVFVILNEHRQIVFTNRTLLNWLGLESEEALLGLRPGEAVSCVHASENDAGCGTTEFCRTCGAVQAILSSLQGAESVQECRITQKDGAALDLRVWATPLEIDGRRLTTFAIQDISHEKRRAVLERIFFHDILNTAGGILGFAEILEDGEFGSPELAKERIRQLSAKLIAEIRAQQELVSAEAYDLKVHLSPINARDFLQEIAVTYRKHEAGKDRCVEIAPDAQAVHFVSDKTLLGRVLGNMTKNALEAINPQETVTLSCAEQGETVEFRVHNPGFIPRNVQMQIFQRSFSTKGSGHGLGTYSMKLLSERYLKGQVSFTSSPEEGTTFKAQYPLRLDE